ncbi:MAG: RHS repeat-associated core domain-containing protein [Candidatus Methanofastidiosia archaeon]|jgi:hypothetical protein
MKHHDPEIGRFITRDTINGKKEVPQTLNKYIYCLNNPLKYVDPSGNESKDPQDAVEEIFESLKNLSPEIVAELQEKVDSGEMTEFQALVHIIEVLGFTVLWADSDRNFLSVKISDDLIIRVRIKERLKDEKRKSLHGKYNPKTKTAFIDFSKTVNVGDMALIFLHEASHGVLYTLDMDIPPEKQEKIIYGVQFSYMVASRLTSVDAQYSTRYMRHVSNLSSIYDPSGIYRPSILDILERWFPRTGHPIN